MSKILKVRINLMKKASTASVSGGPADGSRPKTLMGLGGQGSSEVAYSWPLDNVCAFSIVKTAIVFLVF